MARTLILKIVADSRDAERGFARTSRSARAFGRDMEHAGRGALIGTASFGRFNRMLANTAGVTLGAAGVVAGVKAAITAASDLNEEVNKSSVVFGKSSGQILAWSKQSSRAFGLARSEALAAAGGFGAMLETSGVATDRAASMSEALVKLAADMASFNNEDPTEMLDRLRSGLAGEAEPLRRFGVLLSENRVKSEAYRLGLAKVGAQLTEQQKVQARYSIVLRDTARQQGDFARTSGGLANQLRILRAQIKDNAAAIGTAFLPLVKDATQALNDFLSRPENQKRIRDDAKATAAAFGAIADRIGDAKDTIEGIANLDFNHPPRWLDDMDRDFQRKVDGWKQQIQLLPGIPLFRSGGSGTLDRAGGGTFTPPRPGLRPDNRGGPFGPGLGRSSIPGSVSGTARLPGQPGTGTPFLANLLAQAEGTSGRRDDESVLRRIIGALGGRLGRTSNLAARTDLLTAINQYRGQLQSLLEQDAADVKDAADRIKQRRQNARNAAADALQRLHDALQKQEDAQKAAAQALIDQAGKFKSAILERLQQNRTAVLNRRALADAQEQLRLARELGGVSGIKAAQRNIEDVKFDMLRARLDRAPVTLSSAGQLSLGNVVTINVHGVTNPDVVATKVMEAIKRKGRHTSAQTRGPAAGLPHGV